MFDELVGLVDEIIAASKHHAFHRSIDISGPIPTSVSNPLPMMRAQCRCGWVGYDHDDHLREILMPIINERNPA